MQRPRPAEARVLPVPRLRRLGRWLLCERERLALLRERFRHARNSPRRPLGRFLVRWRLWRRGFVNPRVAVALALFALALLWSFGGQSFVSGSLGETLGGAALGAAFIGALVAVWGDVVRSRLIAWRVRRRIAERPESVLPTTSSRTQAELMAREEEMPIVPREDLYEEVLPGILDRRRGDVLMVVGEPGAGKTTALVGLAGRLARLGFVPVVVPIVGEMPGDLIEAAEKRFERLAGSLLGSSAHLDEVWSWLRTRRRVVVAIDDVDRIAPDGERGYLLRTRLEELASANLPTVVTTRPAGIPAGLAASAIELGELDEEAAVDHVLRVATAEPGATTSRSSARKVRGSVKRWVREGKFAEVPFYLELLARLVATGRCEELSSASAVSREAGGSGRARKRVDGTYEWNPQWVRFQLLEHFHQEAAAGGVHRWLAIERRERESCLEALAEVALATLAASAMQARAHAGEDGNGGSGGGGRCPPRSPRGAKHSAVAPRRSRVEQFLESDDRRYPGEEGRARSTISAHEIVDTGERLRILDRDSDGALHFHHRIMQAYLAGRCLVQRHERSERGPDGRWWDTHPPDWVGAMLDPYYSDRLTAQMTLTFAALYATERGRRSNGEDQRERQFVEEMLDRINAAAMRSLGGSNVAVDEQRRQEEGDARLDPSEPFHPEENRVDPDDALAKLTTAAEIAHATDAKDGSADEIARNAQLAKGATKWTKLYAIPSIAALGVSPGWQRVWEFARSRDQEVRRMASDAIADDACAAYHELGEEIERLLDRAARTSASGQALDRVAGPATGNEAGRAGKGSGRRGSPDVGGDGEWSEKDVLSLRALGWILPAMVSEVREHAADLPPGTASDSDDSGASALAGDSARVATDHPEHVRGAREALDRFVRLAFQGEHPELEAALAQGFKSDAMRHAEAPRWRRGPGLVAHNRRFVADFCIEAADYWYAKMVLHQALALYTIAGSSRQLAFDVYGRLLHRGREPHPFVLRAARLARRAVRRHAIGSASWASLIWVDEGVAVSTRPTGMAREAAQLVADVTLLLNLRECAPEDRSAQFPYMRELPHCLSTSTDRREVLGAGCPRRCGYGLCPLKQPPADEPDGQRTVSRAFCRGQYEIASHRTPPWQRRRISRRKLKVFWRQVERLTRT